MSKLLKRAKAKKVLAEESYRRISDDDIFLDDCCFNLQQCVEMALKYLIEIHGGTYVKNHDIRAQLNVLNTLQVDVPREKDIRAKASLLNSWEAESRYLDSFLACISDIEEIRKLADDLLGYADTLTSKTAHLPKMNVF